MGAKSAVIIDDEPDITTYLAALLSDQGWQVRTANSSADGLALLEQQRPDVVLLDIMMPEKGGLHTLVAIRKNPALAGLPVILVSGIQEKLSADYHAFLERFKHYRPDAFLDKPVDPAQLLATIDQALTSAAAK
ncbi:MAG: response regulator [Acidobacteriota bacterium]